MLSQSQRASIERVRSVGGGNQGVALSDEACSFLVATLARDLRVPPNVLSVPDDLPSFFSRVHPESLQLAGRDFLGDLSSIAEITQDADSYFLCLAKLHKSRLKYQ